jgi:hypothetical protein
MSCIRWSSCEPTVRETPCGEAGNADRAFSFCANRTLRSVVISSWCCLGTQCESLRRNGIAVFENRQFSKGVFTVLDKLWTNYTNHKNAETALAAADAFPLFPHCPIPHRTHAGRFYPLGIIITCARTARPVLCSRVTVVLHSLVERNIRPIVAHAELAVEDASAGLGATLGYRDADSL